MYYHYHYLYIQYVCVFLPQNLKEINLLFIVLRYTVIKSKMNDKFTLYCHMLNIQGAVFQTQVKPISGLNRIFNRESSYKSQL